VKLNEFTLNRKETRAGRRLLRTYLLTYMSRWYIAEVSEYCQWESFNASCNSPTHHQVILMKSARYGRMRFGRCVREDHGSLGCYADVLRQLDARCSGRRYCSVHVPDPSLHDAQSCPKELMPYLETSYVCITGAHGPPSTALTIACSVADKLSTARLP